MILNNENKKISRNGKKRSERRVKLDDKMKSFLNKNKSGKKRKTTIKILTKIKELDIKLVKIKYVINPILLESKLKELNKIQVPDEFLHENKI